jgi:predicted aldo/keto reductase-like oxidoreductase
MPFEPSRRGFLAAAMIPAIPAAVTAAPSTSPALRYGTLGRTGLKVTKLGYGSMVTSDPTVIERAVDLGINYFSTSRDYQNGNNERLLATGLGKNRKNVLLATETVDITLPGRISRAEETTAYLLGLLDTSLKELRTDYVDVWLFHNKNTPDDITPQMREAVESAKKQGKIRFAGTTTHRLPQIAGVLAAGDWLDIVMPIYNFTMDVKMHAAVEQVHKAGLGVIAMKVMAGGSRDHKPKPPLDRPGALTAALQWAMNHPYVDGTVLSMSDADQLQANVECMSAPFGEAERKILAAHLRQIGPEYCRNCGGCDSQCTKGLPVPDMLRYLTYADGYGQFAMAREKFLAHPQTVSAVRCGDCAACTVRCRFGLDVAARLQRAQQLLA